MSTSRKRRRAFTLVEVAMALTILVLIAGCIYAVMRGSVETAAVMEESRNRSLQIEGLSQLCRRLFENLPAHARIESRIRQQGGLAFPEVILRETPGPLSSSASETVTVLGIKPENGGRFSLALLQTPADGDFLSDPAAQAPPSDWLALVPGVTSVKWRFFSGSLNRWLEVLPPGSLRPSAAELTMELAGENHPLRMIFEIMPLSKTPRFESTQPSAS